MKKKKIEDISLRAVKTFIQGFIGALCITLPTTDFSQSSVWKSVLIGAIASGLSATMNYINNLLEKEGDNMATIDERLENEIEESGIVEGDEEND